MMVTVAGYALPANRQSFCPLSWDSALAEQDYFPPLEVGVFALWFDFDKLIIERMYFIMCKDT